MKEILVDENIAGKRLDSFLKSYLSGASGGFIYKMLRKKNITLNDGRADGRERLENGDLIKIFFSEDTLIKFTDRTASERAEAASGINVSIIYEDDNILLASKPAGLLTQRATKNDYNLNDWLIDYLRNKGSLTEERLAIFRPSVCNRLDRNTSGIVICAKSLAGARKMGIMLGDRTLDKYYMTVVHGRLKTSVRLKGWLYKDEKKNRVEICDTDPHNDKFSYIETEYTPLKYSEENDITLTEVKLITGKPHQIRAHLSSIGHPIIGDIKYGGRSFRGLKYQLLHCYRIKFPNKIGDGFENIEGKEFTAELPKFFGELFSEVRE